VFLDHFDTLILKIIFFLKKYYFNIFISEKHFKNTGFFLPEEEENLEWCIARIAQITPSTPLINYTHKK